MYSFVNRLATSTSKASNNKTILKLQNALALSPRNLHSFSNLSPRPTSLFASPFYLSSSPFSSSSSSAASPTADSGNTKGTKSIHIRFNKAIGVFKKYESYPKLLTFMKNNQENFNHVNWSSCWYALSNASLKEAKNVRKSPVFQAFLKETVSKMRMGEVFFDPRHFANIIRAVAMLDLSGPDVDSLFAEVELNSKSLVENGNAKDIADTVWSCATLNRPSPLLFAEVERNCKWIVENGRPEEIANTVWSCATLNYSSPGLFSEVERNRDWFVENGNAKDISNTVWACAVVGGKDLEGNMFKELWNMAMNERNSLSFQNDGLSQLYQVQLCANIEAPDLNLEPMPEALQILVSQALDSQTNKSTSSQARCDISGILSSLAIDHKNEYSALSQIDEGFASDTFLAIDVAIVEEKIAIEFCCASHFVQSPCASSELGKNGPTILKERLLRKLGWSLISVPFNEWEERTKEEKASSIAEYLRVAREGNLVEKMN